MGEVCADDDRGDGAEEQPLCGGVIDCALANVVQEAVPHAEHLRQQACPDRLCWGKPDDEDEEGTEEERAGHPRGERDQREENRDGEHPPVRQERIHRELDAEGEEKSGFRTAG